MSIFSYLTEGIVDDVVPSTGLVYERDFTQQQQLANALEPEDQQSVAQNSQYRDHNGNNNRQSSARDPVSHMSGMSGMSGAHFGGHFGEMGRPSVVSQPSSPVVYCQNGVQVLPLDFSPTTDEDEIEEVYHSHRQF